MKRSHRMAITCEVNGVSKRFGELAALTDVTFRVQSGEVLGLIGPNGAGKSTLFECLAGLLPIDSGQVRRESPLFYIPDGISPWPEQSLAWVLDYAIGYFGGRPDLRAEVVEQLGLRPLLRQAIGTLSKGQRKRALLGIGLLTPQPVLLIDEPFDGLDLRQSREVGAALRTHAAQGRTLFLSIHQIRDASRFCDRFVLLSEGRVRGEGNVAELAALASGRRALADPGDLEEVFLALT
jgi:ABC-2 type transport system ATP-binding protein